MNATVDRLRIYIFVAVTYAVSIGSAMAVYLNGGLFLEGTRRLTPLAMSWLALVMFTPALAHVVTRLVTREGWSNMLLRPRFRRGWPYWLAGWLLPPLLTILGGALYYLLFPDRFDPLRQYATQNLGVLSLAPDVPPAAYLLTSTLLVLIGLFTTLPVMFGEEFGWRAYLLPKLMPLGGRKAVLLVGLIHGAWHWPFILMGYEYGFGYWGAPVAGPLLWLVVTCFLSTVLAWLTLRGGSVWPAVLAHGTFNGAASLMVAFSARPVDSLIGPVVVGIVGSAGLAALALLIFFSPPLLAPIEGTPPPASRPVHAPAPGAAD